MGAPNFAARWAIARLRRTVTYHALPAPLVRPPHFALRTVTKASRPPRICRMRSAGPSRSRQSTQFRGRYRPSDVQLSGLVENTMPAPISRQKGHAAGRDVPGDGGMFEKRSELVRLLAVAETGRIDAAAGRLVITQPALTASSRGSNAGSEDGSSSACLPACT